MTQNGDQTRYERRDVSLKAVLLVLLLTGVSLAIILFVLREVLSTARTNDRARWPTPAPVAARLQPAGPRLQRDPRVDLLRLRDWEDIQLRDVSTVMEHVTNQGLPVRAQPEPPEDAP